MAYSNSELEGKSFYQSEPLIARLRGIIRDYPEGVGILKELIQNADDAKATRVERTLDWRNHQVKKLPDDRMVLLMGPAMLVYNCSYPVIIITIMLEIRLVKTAEESKQVFKFRYQIYVEKLGCIEPYADREQRTLEQPFEETANIFAVFQNGELVGTIRINFANKSNLGYYPQLYRMRDFAGEAHPRYTSVTSKLRVQKDIRGTTLALRLLKARYQLLITNEIKFDFGDCVKNDLAFYQKSGCQVIGNGIYPEYGETIHRMLDVFNFGHLKKINSPLKRLIPS